MKDEVAGQMPENTAVPLIAAEAWPLSVEYPVLRGESFLFDIGPEQH